MSGSTIRIVVAEDHPIFSQAVRDYLSGEPDFQVVALVGQGAGLDAVIVRHRPDLLLLDLQMEPGFDPIQAIHRLREACPSLKILILSAHDEATWVSAMLMARVDGYVHKSETLETLVQVIRKVTIGEVWFSHRLFNAFASEYYRDGVLAPRERMALQTIADGRRLANLASELRVSERTVEGYLHNARGKLGVQTRTEAVAVAMRQGVIE